MPDNTAAIVIDIGTTNCKVSCYSCLDASVMDVRKFPTPKRVSGQGDVDFDINQLWQTIKCVMAELIMLTPVAISRISIASFGESGVFIDEDGTILTPMLAWYDRRGEDYLSALNEAQKQELYSITGLPPHSNYSAFKMRWLLENYPLPKHRGMRWLHAPEVLLWLLTGQKRTEITLASRTLCLDVTTCKWSRQAAELLKIPFDVLAPLLEPGEIAGWVTPVLAKELGITSDVSVTLAGHDHMVGARALQLVPGEALNSTGTTEGILLLTPQPLLDAQAQRNKLANGRYSDGDLCTLFASLPIGGYALEWLRRTFRLTEEEIDTALARVWLRYQQASWSPNAVPVFIPHLRGSGSPNKNRATRGLLYGLGDTLGADTLVESIFMGLTMEFANCYGCFNVPAGRPLKVIGPAVNNPFWLQLKADVLQCPVEAIAFDEAVSVGALLVACPDLSPPSITLAGRYFPNPQRAEKIKEYQMHWLEFYNFKLEQEGVFAIR